LPGAVVAGALPVLVAPEPFRFTVVLVPVEAPTGVKKAVLKKHPAKMMSIARDLLAGVDEVAVDMLLGRFVEETPRDGAVRDRRRRTATTALDFLLDNKYLVLRNPDTVALTQATQAATVDFTKEQNE
jgi:hypothetical protein